MKWQKCALWFIVTGGTEPVVQSNKPTWKREGTDLEVTLPLISVAVGHSQSLVNGCSQVRFQVSHTQNQPLCMHRHPTVLQAPLFTLSLPRHRRSLFVGWLLNVQQLASVSQGRIYSDNFTCCHTEIEVADQTFHLTQSQYTDFGPTSPSTDPITPGA